MEVGGYRRISNYETQRARSLFSTATAVVANRLLRAHPDPWTLADEVLQSEIIRPYLDIGPFRRLCRSDRALKALHRLLANSQIVIDYQWRGLLEWDDGDAQGAMAIVHTWHRVVTSRGGQALDGHDWLR